MDVLEGTLALGKPPGVAAADDVAVNDGADAVTGTFAGLAENAVFATGGRTFRINYGGGTGNDVTLTLVTLGTGVTRNWDGGGTDNNWTTAANWVDLPGNPPSAPSPGDDLVFPAGAARLSNTNNFAVGTVFNSLTIGTGGVTLSGSSVQLHAGVNFTQASGSSTVSLPVTMTRAQAVTVTGAGIGTMAGAFTSGGFPLTVEVAAGGSAAVNLFSGTGTLTKTGPGSLSLGSGNTFAGSLTVSAGEAFTTALTGAGSGVGGLFVSPGAALRFNSIASGTVSKILNLGGSLTLNSSTLTFSNSIILPPGNDGIVSVTGGNTATFSGQITGTGKIDKRNAGTLTLSGGASNTFSGGAIVTDGTLRLQKTAGINAINGPLTVGDGAGTDTLLLVAANQIADTVNVTLNGAGAVFDGGTFSETVRSLTFTGGTVNGSGTLSLNANLTGLAAATTAAVNINLATNNAHTLLVEDGAAAVDFQSNGAWTDAGGNGIVRTGEGTAVFAGDGNAASLSLTAGLTRVAANWQGTPVTLDGGVLGGSGTVGAVTAASAAGGGVQPGASPEILTVRGDLTGDEKRTFTFEIGGTAPGTGHDQIVLTGRLDPQKAALEIVFLPGFTPMTGQSFTLVDIFSTDSTASEFSGAPDGSEFTIGPVTASVSYTGGDRNDTVLTIRRINATGDVRHWDGGGANDNWTNAANWQDDIAPVQGDVLDFPAGAAGATINDFPAGTNFHRITIADAGYSFTGNAIALNKGVDATFTTGICSFGVPVTLTQPQTVRCTGGELNFTAAAPVTNNTDVLITDVSSGATLNFNGVISGSGAVYKTGGGLLGLHAANTFTATHTVSQGTTRVTTSSGIGGGASVTAAGTLILDAAAPLTIAGGITLRGQLTSTGALHRLNGPLTLPAGGLGTVEVSTHRLDLAGRVQSGGALRKTGPGVLGLIGTLSNTFTGGLTILGGDVIAGKPAGVNAVPGPVTIGDAGTVTPPRRLILAAANQIADAATARVLGAGSLLDLAGFAEQFTGLEFTGGGLSTGAGTLTLTGNVITFPAATTATVSGHLILAGAAGQRDWSIADGAAHPDVEISAHFATVAGVEMHKLGSGSLSFSSAISDNATVKADAGTLIMLGNQPGLTVRLDGATVTGNGTFGSVAGLAGGGVLDPGPGIAMLTPLGLISSTGVTMRFVINGPAPGTRYDQLRPASSSNLNGATLDLDLTYSPDAGESFTLINSTNVASTITGAFNGLPQFGYFSQPGGLVFRINYHGGDGNDVVITREEVPDPLLNSWSIAPGTGPNAGSDVLSVSITGTAGVTYVLETSPDLENWTVAATTIAPAGGVVNFQHLQPPGAQRTFARSRVE